MKEDKKIKRERTDDEKMPDVGIRLGAANKGYENNQPEKERGKVYKWLDNFWYHYKWHTIIISFLLVVVTVCTVQSLRTTKYDMKIVYAGSKNIEAKEAEAIQDLFVSLVPEDTNKDGKTSLVLNKYYILSEEQLKEGDGKYDANRNSNDYSNFQSYLQTGDASIMLLEPWIYESVPKESLCKLSELFGDGIPNGAIDEYAVRLGDLDIYKHFALKNLPEETLVCLQMPLYHERKLKSSTEKLYEMEKSTFVAFVTYSFDGQ